jgi:hypothetical protein
MSKDICVIRISSSVIGAFIGHPAIIGSFDTLRSGDLVAPTVIDNSAKPCLYPGDAAPIGFWILKPVCNEVGCHYREKTLAGRNQLKKSLFEIEMTKAEVMGGVERAAYWTGYKNGLQRRFHGEAFGTRQEHDRWLSAAADGDEEQKEQSRGYRDGYLGVVDLQDPANGIQILRNWRGWSVDQLADMVGVSPDRVKA